MEDLSDKLVDNGPFQSKQKALMFAAAVGVNLGSRKKLSSPDVAIRWDIFERNNDDTFIHALAVAETGGLEILNNASGDSEDLITIFEEYSKAGLQYLKGQVLNSPGDVLDELIQFSLSMERSSDTDSRGLQGITDEDLDVLGI